MRLVSRLYRLDLFGARLFYRLVPARCLSPAELSVEFAAPPEPSFYGCNLAFFVSDVVRECLSCE